MLRCFSARPERALEEEAFTTVGFAQPDTSFEKASHSWFEVSQALTDTNHVVQSATPDAT